MAATTTSLGRRAFHVSAPSLAGGKTKIKAQKGVASKSHRLGGPSDGEVFDMRKDLQPFIGQDVPKEEHLKWSEARRRLEGLRMIKYQMPSLSQFKQPFVPPPKDACIVLKTRDPMFGDPLQLSQTPLPSLHHVDISISISSLPTQITCDPLKLYKLQVLAGQHWKPSPTTAGEGTLELSSHHFPTRLQNEQFLSTVVDSLLEECSNLDSDSLNDLPRQPYVTTSRVEKRKRKLESVKFPNGWLHPTTRDLIQQQQVEQVELDTNKQSEVERSNEKLRSQYKWNGIGLAPLGTFNNVSPSEDSTL